MQWGRIQKWWSCASREASCLGFRFQRTSSSSSCEGLHRICSWILSSKGDSSGCRSPQGLLHETTVSFIFFIKERRFFDSTTKHHSNFSEFVSSYPEDGRRRQDTVPITTRQLEALIRLSQARAKACLREFVLGRSFCVYTRILKISTFVSTHALLRVYTYIFQRRMPWMW